MQIVNLGEGWTYVSHLLVIICCSSTTVAWAPQTGEYYRYSQRLHTRRSCMFFNIIQS